MFDINHYLKKYDLVLSHFGIVICNKMINTSSSYKDDPGYFVERLEYYFHEYNKELYNIYSDRDIYNIVDYLCGNVDSFYAV